MHSALLSWAYWTGQKDLVLGLEREGVDCTAGPYAEISDLLLKLIAGLYFPVSQDTCGATDYFHETWNDHIYHEISQNLHVPLRPFWPNGHPFAVILSHDIDRVKQTYQGAWAHLRKRQFLRGLLHVIKRILPFDPRQYSDPYRNLGRILTQEKTWGIKSAIFVLREKRRFGELLKGRPQHVFGIYDPREIRDEIQMLLENGHEVGLHVSLDGFRSKEVVSQEREYMESLWGIRLEGARTHYLLFSEDTPSILLENGFSYDSSMGFNFHNGFRCGTVFPFVRARSGGKHLWEVPFHIMDTALIWQVKNHSLPHTGRGMVSTIRERVKEQGGLLVINWHQRHFNRAFDPALFYLMEEVILKSKEEGAWVTTPKQLLRWWSTERLGQ